MARQSGQSRAWAARWRRLGRLGIGAAIATGLFATGPTAARQAHPASQASANAPIFEWILLDAETGQVLSEQNADVMTPPASLTKMMTLYLTFEALNQGRVRLDQPFSVSSEAASRAPSKLALVPGESVPLRELILGIVTKSANDAATVVAENLAGSEARFAQYMTWKARQLGMQHTWYHNASGLPDPEQRTTARDVARLALALYHQFPREYRYFATREFVFRGSMMHTHNHLLDWYQGADGIKTGFVNASGFNLAASAVRDGHRLIGVIMGGHSPRGRDVQMASLLDQGFAVLAARQGQPPPQSATVVASAAATAAPIATASTAGADTAATHQRQGYLGASATAAAPPVTDAAEGATRQRQGYSGAAVAAAATPTNDATDSAAAPHAQKGYLGNVAAAALRHLSPVSKAEASPIAHQSAPAGEDWAIQLGAFRSEAAAEQATRHASGIAAVRGKPAHVVAPGAHETPRLYRARLLHFTAKGAPAACAELRKHGVACSVVRPGALNVASQ